MYNVKFKPESENFRDRFKYHLERCRLYFEDGGTLHNSVDYFFSKERGSYPNLDVDFNIANGVNYEMC